MDKVRGMSVPLNCLYHTLPVQVLVTDFFGSVRHIELMTVNERDLEIFEADHDVKEEPRLRAFKAAYKNLTVSQAPPPLAIVSLV